MRKCSHRFTLSIIAVLFLSALIQCKNRYTSPQELLADRNLSEDLYCRATVIAIQEYPSLERIIADEGVEDAEGNNRYPSSLILDRMDSYVEEKDGRRSFIIEKEDLESKKDARLLFDQIQAQLDVCSLFDKQQRVVEDRSNGDLYDVVAVYRDSHNIEPVVVVNVLKNFDSPGYTVRIQVLHSFR